MPGEPTPAMINGKMTYVRPDEIEYEIPNSQSMFAHSMNMVPMMSSVHGLRALMGSKFMTQALPLKKIEAPLVESLDEETGDSFSKRIGERVGLVKAPEDGIVEGVFDDNIRIKNAKGKKIEIPLRNYLPQNKKTYTKDYSLVKPGDQITAGQTIAHSNYTTPDGELAYGANLRIAFMPGPQGKTFEDAITVSESAAQKLTSTHLYNFGVDNKLGMQSGKNKFIQLFPNKYTKEQLDKIDDNGMVKPGIELEPGDPVFLSYMPRTLRAQDKALGNLNKVIKNAFIDRSQTWEKPFSGKSVDSIVNRHGYSANIVGEAPLQFADKISGRFAAKGVTALIQPDEKMFKDSEGNTIDVLINPASLIGRVNPASALEAILGKIAMKTGKKYKVANFSDDSNLEFVEKEMKKYGISDTEELFDPVNNRKIPNVMTGVSYMMKLEHQSADKWSAIDEGTIDQNDQPGKPGGHDSCFTEDQEILTIDGKIKIGFICENKVKADVITYDKEADSFAVGTITDWFIYKKPCSDVLSIGFQSLPEGTTQEMGTIYPTKNHWIYDESVELKQASEFRVGDMLLMRNKNSEIEPVEITSIEQRYPEAEAEDTINVYDFTVDKTHNYLAGPILVSNSKKVGYLEVLGLLGHGATENLADIQQYRSGANREMWRRIRMGMPLPAPEVPFIYNKFTETLRGAGINTEKKGNKIIVKALRKRDIDEITGDREIRTSETLDPVTKEPIRGGLLDMALHGIDGKKWSYIKMDEPLPNPILEEPLRRVLGITKQKMLDVMSGKDNINGRTGSKALMDAYASTDKKELEALLMKDVRSGRRTVRDVALKRLNAIKGIEKQGLEADDLFMQKVPVLPAAYRPVNAFGNMMLTADANYLYKDLMEARDARRITARELGEEEAGEETLTAYKALEAVVGLGDPIHPKNAQKGVKGFVRQLSEGGPKRGQFLDKVIGHTVNTIGRGVVIPDTEMDMDTLGVPENIAWKLFGAHTMGRMVRAGMNPEQAALNIERRSDYAKKFLLQEMDYRPVMLNRAPSLHKFNTMAFKPKLVTGDGIMVSPLVVKPFGMDFDGDSGVFVVVIRKALDNDKTKGESGGLMLNKPQLKLSEDGNETFVANMQDIPIKEETIKKNEDGTREAEVDGNYLILSIDPKTAEQKWLPIEKVSAHPHLKMWLVNTKRGDSLTISEDHSLLSYKNGEITPTSPSDLKPGKTLLPVTDMMDIPLSRKDSFVMKSERNGESFELPLNKDTGIFLGMVIGDGCINADNHIYLYGAKGGKNKNREVFKDIVNSDDLPYGGHVGEVEFQATNIEGNGTHTSRRSVVSDKTWFSSVIKKHIGTSSLEKRIPSFSLNGSDEHIWGVLDGLLSTDGSVSVSNVKKNGQLLVSYSTSSPFLAEGIKSMCKIIGVRATITKYASKSSGRDAFLISFSTVDLKKAHDKGLVSISHPEKWERFSIEIAKVATNTAYGSKDILPYPEELHTFLTDGYKMANGFKYKNLKSGEKTYDIGSLPQFKSKGSWSRISAREYMDKIRGHMWSGEMEDYYNNFISNENLKWDLVETAEPIEGEHMGYDITVHGTYNFVTQYGTFVQDTTNIHVPISPKAVEEARNKLMPSQNLFDIKQKKVHYVPSQEFTLGIYNSTQLNPSKNGVRFKNSQDAIQAYASGEIDIDTPVEIG